MLILAFSFFGFLKPPELYAQKPAVESVPWIRPDSNKTSVIWGIKNGIIFSLWPNPVEPSKAGSEGGPRGLIRVGYDYMEMPYLINFIAVEPVVAGEMEFSEVRPSLIDGNMGKYFWASDSASSPEYPARISAKGVINHPDSLHPEIEELSVFIFMERFKNGAHPFLRLSVRSSNPDEICIQIFSEKNSAPMERCGLTATMGNYSRLRLLHLKAGVVDSRKLYSDYHDIGFAEKNSYARNQLLRNKKGDYIVMAEPSETFSELADWPQTPAYSAHWNWRYRPFYKLTQYWRKEKKEADPSLQVRVNGRSKYWAGGSDDKKRYIAVPGGIAFENFEMREKFQEGQKFYFGLTRKPILSLIYGR